ncbi:MAG TPA: 3-deoxy-D-manno-octulosonic acid transferase [Alphaproteobacteria bacterium]
MSALGLYRAFTVLGAPAIVGYLGLRRLHGKEDRARFSERLGKASLPRRPGPLVWIHGASVGEAQSALVLVARILSHEAEATALVTTGTVSSARLLAERLPERAIHQYVPADHPAWVGRFLDHWQPDVGLWIESELWPNLVVETAERNIPMVLVNARMSARSFANWRLAPGAIRQLLACFRRVLAQSEADGERYAKLGAREVAVTGSLKYDADPLPADSGELKRLAAEIGDRPRWLAASTHPGEERTIAAAHRLLKLRHPGLLTILVPRHAGRGDELAAALRGNGLAVARRSNGEPAVRDTDVYLADTMGELGLLYRLTEVVFVGGSLVRHGGQNMLEPARFGCALLYGPHVHNFRAIAADLIAVGAAEVVRDERELADAVSALLADETARAKRGAAAKHATEAGRGVLDDVIAALGPELEILARTPNSDRDGIGRARA